MKAQDRTTLNELQDVLSGIKRIAHCVKYVVPMLGAALGAVLGMTFAERFIVGMRAQAFDVMREMDTIIGIEEDTEF